MATDGRGDGPGKVSSAFSNAARNLIAPGIVAGAAGAVVLALINGALAAGFAAGYSVGLLNAFWLLRTARRGVGLEPQKAGRFIAFNYYVRFAATAAIFSILVVKGIFNVLALVGGLGAAIAVFIAVMIFTAKKEASKDA